MLGRRCVYALRVLADDLFSTRLSHHFLDKKIIFLVPKVPLVDQQANVLMKHTPLRVKGYYGQMGVDAWDRAIWAKEFEENDALVMTAQIYYNIILHAYWSLEKVCVPILLRSGFGCA